MKTLLLTAIASILIADFAVAAPRPFEGQGPRTFIEVDAGRGFVASAADVFGGTDGRIIMTDWVGVRMRPFTDYQSESIGLHFGLHSGKDVLKNTACRSLPGIAGQRFCSTNAEEFDAGAHFLALYSGVQAELIELFSREPRPMHVYLGAGASMIQSVSIDTMTVPYSSVEVGYQFRKQLHAKAGIFLSVPRDNSLGIAMSEVTLMYRF